LIFSKSNNLGAGAVPDSAGAEPIDTIALLEAIVASSATDKMQTIN
jgi:hypothetical protein